MKQDIFDYLEKNTNTISEKAFSHIDAFVLSVFAYLPYGKDTAMYKGDKGIDPIGMSMGSFTAKLISPEYIEILNAVFKPNKNNESDPYKKFCDMIANSRRFKDLKITNSSYFNADRAQFAAYTVELDLGKKCVAFRGTDGTFDGWYEDFELVYEEVPAQILAREYLTNELKCDQSSGYYVTGHSKGGNLSTYATFSAHTRTDKIIRAYSFDGPGFNEQVLAKYKNEIMAIRNKIDSYLIQNSVIGELLFGQKRIFEDRINYIKCKWNLIALAEHSPFEWIIEDNDFIYVSQSLFSKITNLKLDTMIRITPQILLAKVIQLFFGALKLLNIFEDDTERELNKKINRIYLLTMRNI